MLPVYNGPLQKIEKVVVPSRIPRLLLYGDSHITRLERWRNQLNIHIMPNQPTDLDRLIMSKAEFCAVGGSRYDTIHDRVQRINVPSH